MFNEENKFLNKKITKKEKEFLKKIVEREIGNAIMKTFETIARFGQHKMRDLETRGIIVSYGSEIRRERDGWVLVIRASVPDWLIEEIALSRVHYVKMLRRLKYSIRAAERYLAGLPGLAPDFGFVPLPISGGGEEVSEEPGDFIDEEIEVEIEGVEPGGGNTRSRDKGSREGVEGDGESGG